MDMSTRNRPVAPKPNVPARALLQRTCACGTHAPGGGECEECKKKRLQRQATGAHTPNVAPPIVHDVLRAPGQPLDAGTRAFMEPRFGHDFSRVRVHTDPAAAASARAVGALAYTVGPHIAFGAGQYAPGTPAGQRLLAHELTHVVQQGPEGALQTCLAIGSADTSAEREADAVAGQVIASTAVPGVSRVQATLQRVAIHSGRILYEGDCEHLACNSKWACEDPEGITCPDGTRNAFSSKQKRFRPLFTCDARCDNNISCSDNGDWMAIPSGRFARRKCGQSLVICANGRSADAHVRDRSEREAWEVSPGIIDALGVARASFTGSIYGDRSDPAFARDTHCGSGGRASADDDLGSIVSSAASAVQGAVSSVADIFGF
jgi:hypothetical protein